jgi:hypothetical protein
MYIIYILENIPDDEPVSSKHVKEEAQNGILKLK